MNRREYLIFSGYTLTGMVFAPLQASRHPLTVKPNVILIMADDLGYECLGCNGSLDYSTPNLDRLAKQGIRFTHCFSQPLCTPSRVQIMTGRYNHRNYIGFGEMKQTEITFGNILRQSGYRTCIAGKWQLGRDRKLVDHFGFDEYCLWWLENKSDRYQNVGELIRNGEVLPGKKGEYGPDVVNTFILDFISRHKNEPFFCYYPMLLTHPPFVPTPDSPDQKSTDIKQNFTDMVAYMDKIVGKIENFLDSIGLLDNTLIIFTGDNGTPDQINTRTKNGNYQGGKGMMTEAGMHVPLIVYWKGVTPSGKVCGDLIDFSDFLPTIAEVTNSVLPKDRIIDGRSFLRQIKGEKNYNREWIFCYYWGGGRRPEGTKEFVMDKRWKVYGDGTLFDILNDPLEESPIQDPRGELLTAKSKLQQILKDVKGN